MVRIVIEVGVVEDKVGKAVRNETERVVCALLQNLEFILNAIGSFR